jgi:hypothetical protein
MGRSKGCRRPATTWTSRKGEDAIATSECPVPNEGAPDDQPGPAGGPALRVRIADCQLAPGSSGPDHRIWRAGGLWSSYDRSPFCVRPRPVGSAFCVPADRTSDMGVVDRMRGQGARWRQLGLAGRQIGIDRRASSPQPAFNAGRVFALHKNRRSGEFHMHEHERGTDAGQVWGWSALRSSIRLVSARREALAATYDRVNDV